jgi:hypothetical protein
METKMPKITEDSWMNPSRTMSWKAPPPKNGTYWVIERKKATPVTGNVTTENLATNP